MSQIWITKISSRPDLHLPWRCRVPDALHEIHPGRNINFWTSSSNYFYLNLWNLSILTQNDAFISTEFCRFLLILWVEYFIVCIKKVNVFLIRQTQNLKIKVKNINCRNNDQRCWILHSCSMLNRAFARRAITASGILFNWKWTHLHFEK